MRKTSLLTLVACLSVAALIGSPTAIAGDTACVGILPPGTYDNVVVPPGENCTITGSTVRGSIKALQGSQLVVNTTTVYGNVEGDKADLVQVNLSTVLAVFAPIHGNISIKEGGPAHAPYPAGAFNCFPDNLPCEVQMLGTTVRNGNVQVEKMTGNVAMQQSTVENGNVKIEDNMIPADDVLFIVQNTIAQNLQVFKNRGPGAKFVSGNVAGQAVQCKENDPPFVGGSSGFGGPNVGSTVEGQCS